MSHREFIIDGEEVRRFNVQFVFQWGEWMWKRKTMNWQNFTFVMVEMEHETCMFDTWTFAFALLGIGVSFQWRSQTPTKEMAQAMARVDQISAGLRDGKTPEEVGMTLVCPLCSHPYDKE